MDKLVALGLNGWNMTKLNPNKNSKQSDLTDAVWTFCLTLELNEVYI